MTDLKISIPNNLNELREQFEKNVECDYGKAFSKEILGKNDTDMTYINPLIQARWLGYVYCFEHLSSPISTIKELLLKPEVVLANMKRGIIANPFKDLEERCSMLETELDKAFIELRKAHEDLRKVQNKVFADNLMEQNASKFEALCKACSGQDNV